MAAPTDDVLVDLVFLLAIAEPKAITPVLARLGTLLQDPIQLEHIRNQAQPEDLVQFLRQFLVDSNADSLSA
jgi:mannitol/fructose-specific phosphotransferase system IIA component (Ntr-type)